MTIFAPCRSCEIVLKTQQMDYGLPLGACPFRTAYFTSKGNVYRNPVFIRQGWRNTLEELFLAFSGKLRHNPMYFVFLVY